MIITSILLLIVFTLCSGFFSASETSLFSLSQMRLRAYARSHQPRQRLIARLMAQPRKTLVTILMMNVLANLLVQNTASNLFGQFAVWALKVGVPLVLTLLFGEIIPKSIALPNNERISRGVAPTISVLHRILRPIRRLVTRLTMWISRLMFFFLKREQEISPEELRHALETSQRHGVLSNEEAELIQGFLDFQDITVKELLRPRGELLVYDLKQPMSYLMTLFSDQECSRLPVCDGGLENIQGVIEATEFFLQRERIHDAETLKRHLDRPFFVPESMAARTLWHRFRERKEQLAVVVDEYGSIAGLITLEDLVEVVVGDIADRRDARSRYTRAGPGVIIASGKLELAEFNEIFNTYLMSDSNLVTIGGWLTEQMGHLPKAGMRYVTDEFLFHVLAAEPNRVRRVYIRRLQAPEGEG